MIKFTLRCANTHEFEAWFRNSETYEHQAAAGEIPCPLCSDTRVGKAIMAPSIVRGNARNPQPLTESKPQAQAQDGHPAEQQGERQPGPGHPGYNHPSASVPAARPSLGDAGDDAGTRQQPMTLTEAEFKQVARELRREVEQNCDYVGARFPEEARRIQSGETGNRPIYGEASQEESQALRDEGLNVQTIPWIPLDDA